MKTPKYKALLATSFITAGSLTGAANAAVVINLFDNGTDTTVSASGSFDVTDLTRTTTGGGGGIDPFSGFLEITNNSYEIFQGVSGPGSFGTGRFSGLPVSSGDRVGIRWGAGQAITAPAGYVSGTPLSSSGTFTGASFDSLGVTPGTYVWTWGSGPTADSLTLNATVIPEASSTLLLGLGFLGFAARRQRR